jgi:hypothetical protein
MPINFQSLLSFSVMFLHISLGLLYQTWKTFFPIDGTNIIYVKTDASNVIHVSRKALRRDFSASRMRWGLKKVSETGAFVSRKIHYA